MKGFSAENERSNERTRSRVLIARRDAFHVARLEITDPTTGFNGQSPEGRIVRPSQYSPATAVYM